MESGVGRVDRIRSTVRSERPNVNVPRGTATDACYRSGVFGASDGLT